MNTSTAKRQRRLIALVTVLGLSVWFSVTAVAPSLRADWAIGATAALWLTASVQLGFAAGAVMSAVANLADRMQPQYLLAASCLGAATCTAVVALVVDGLAAAIPLRFCTGMLLAGVYPVAMKLTASWSESTDRGRTFGVLLAALTLGSASPLLFAGLGPLPWRLVLIVAAAASIAAAVIAATAIRPGPRHCPDRITWNPRHAYAIFADRAPRLVSLSYLGHMWELYALWTWLPAFVIGRGRQRDALSALPTGVIVFATIGLAGAVGCVLGGWASDRFGRRPAAVTALVGSGSCCALSPAFFVAPTIVLIAFLAIWGAAAVADSGVFSTTLSETTDQRVIGTALTMQTATGFLLTVVPIQLLPCVADLVGWRYAFVLLAPGPLLGAIAMSCSQPSEERNVDVLTTHDATGRPDR
ncbi:MFS transporter [soil metagenome]